RIKLVLYVGVNVSQLNLRLDGVGESYDLVEPAETRGLTQRNLPQDMRATALNGQQALGRLGKGQLDGKAYTTFTVERILVPTKGGSVQIGPARATCVVAVGKKEATWFDSPWEDLNKYERKVVASPPVSVEIKELPSPRPAGFSGLVGEYTIESGAT